MIVLNVKNHANIRIIPYCYRIFAALSPLTTRGPVCFSCHQQPSQSSCEIVTTCKKGEVNLSINHILRERGGVVVGRRTPNREVLGSIPYRRHRVVSLSKSN